MDSLQRQHVQVIQPSGDAPSYDWDVSMTNQMSLNQKSSLGPNLFKSNDFCGASLLPEISR